MKLEHRIIRLETTLMPKDEPVEIFGIVTTLDAVAQAVRESLGAVLQVVRRPVG